jgi:hypothetical protein
VGADPVLGAVPDRADVQVGIERAEGPLDLGQGLAGRDDPGAVQVAGLHAGAQHVNAVQLRLGGDGVLVPVVAEVVLADVDLELSRRWRARISASATLSSSMAYSWVVSVLAWPSLRRTTSMETSGRDQSAH